MTDYILRTLHSSKRAFLVDASFEIMGIQIYTQAKLDLGANISVIPLRSLDFAIKMGYTKQNEEIVYQEIGKKLTDQGCKLDGQALTSSIKRIDSDGPSVFYQTLPDITLDDAVQFHTPRILVTTDTRGYVLIGMDLLSQLEIHCGDSIISNQLVDKGDYILLADKKDRDNPAAFYRALQEYLGYSKIWGNSGENIMDLADAAAASTQERFSHEDVFGTLRKKHSPR